MGASRSVGPYPCRLASKCYFQPLRAVLCGRILKFYYWQCANRWNKIRSAIKVTAASKVMTIVATIYIATRTSTRSLYHERVFDIHHIIPIWGWLWKLISILSRYLVQLRIGTASLNQSRPTTQERLKSSPILCQPTASNRKSQ